MEKKKYILGSHNSWSYLKPRKWWMRLIAWTARCQSCDIVCQYILYGVRCFDLRLRPRADGSCCLAHGLVEYNSYMLKGDLSYLNARGDVMVRVMHETHRHGKQCTDAERNLFRDRCRELQQQYPNIRFFGGYDVRSWLRVFDFGTQEPSQDGCYASNQKPKIIDDWWPWWYAKRNNRCHREIGTTCEVLVLDYVEL